MFDDTTNFQVILEAKSEQTARTEEKIEACSPMFDPLNSDGIQIDYSREIGALRSQYVAAFLTRILKSIRRDHGTERDEQSIKTIANCSNHVTIK